MKRLFIVEDEAIIAMDLAEQLEEFGFDVVGIAHDGESAIQQLQNLNPDLILMDIVLGNGIDGIETAEEVLKTRSIPIIFLTAFSDLSTVARAAKVAPYGYITKPYNTQSLRASIEVALTKHQLEFKLLYKERWFSNILHAVHDGIVAVGIDGLIHFANQEACRLLEVNSVDELIKKDI
ncbi:response regulator, partial [Oceanospirillum sp. HFRX-1_2]